MASFMKKLNTLVRASIQGALSDDPGHSPRRKKSADIDLDKEIISLRKQIDAALDHEERMKSDLESLQQVVASWDRKADEAMAAGDEAAARHAVRQMQLQQQRLTVLEADLEQHRMATAELISSVNAFEATVAEAQQPTPQTPHDVPGASVGDTSDDSLSERLRRASKKAAPGSPAAATRPTKPPAIDEDKVDDDLARRRARLTQPD